MLPVLFAGSIFFQTESSAQAWTIFNDANSQLPQNTVRCIGVDLQNRKWVGTDYGLGIYNDTTWTVYTVANTSGGLTDNGIRTITFDVAGNAWLGTFNGGMVKFDGTNWTSYTTSNSGVPDNFVKAIAFDTPDTMWVGTPSGLAKFDGATWTIWNINNTQMLSHHITCIAIGSNHMKYLGTLNGGMVYFDGDTTWQFFDHVNGLLPDNTALSITLDSTGARWIAMPAHGISVFYDAGPSFNWDLGTSLIPSNAIVHIMVDSLQRKYCSSQNEGFIIFDGTNFVNYTTTNSPMPDDHVLCTTKDRNGILWVGTYNGGLVRVDEAVLAGVNEISRAEDFILYPNPAKNILYLSGIKTGAKSFTITDITGKILLQKTVESSNSFQDVSFLSQGIYFLKIFSDSGTITKKFVRSN